jgi:hypothetical protein
MKQETQAVLQVAKLVVFATLTAIAVNLAIIYVPFKTLAIICGIFATGFFLKYMYDIALCDIRYREKLKEIAKK